VTSGDPVLVTGGAGFVGANLVRRLVERGADVHAILHPGSDLWRIADVLRSVSAHEGSIEDADFVDHVVEASRPSHVYHLAAYGAYSEQRDYQRMVAVNTLGTFHLLDALARRSECHGVVHTGSSSEYGLKHNAPGERELPEPNSSYAVTKCAATLTTSLYARLTNLPACSVRLYSVYGPWEEPSRLMPRLIRGALEGQLPAMTSPSTARDFVMVDDAIDCILRAAEHAGSHRGAVWNVGSGTQTSLGELVALVVDELGVADRPRWGAMPSRAWDTDRWIADPSLARTQLEWSARTPLRDGIRQFANWLRDSPARDHYS
jgi:nucleoside-diphosphate-sugar epimerase